MARGAGMERERVKRRAAPRTTIAVQGARVHNLKNISLELPRDSLIVLTGLSGSGKSSLAFDTIYAEGQRRYMESLSTLREAVRRPGGEARRRLRVRPVAGDLDRAEDPLEQPALDRRHDDRHRQLPEPALRDDRPGRTAREPASRRPAGRRARSSRRSCRCPKAREIELRAPVFKVYGEELDFVFTEVRKKGCRRLIVDGKPVDSRPRGERRRRRKSARWTRWWTGSSSAGSTRRRSRPGSPARCSSATA